MSLLKAFPDAGRLDSYAEVICGPFGSEITSADYKESGVPLLRISNITSDGKIDESDLIFLSQEKSDALLTTQVKPGDVVISQRGTLGIPAIIPDTRPTWNISANLIAIRRIKKISGEFIQLYLSSSTGGSQVERCQSGQVQGKITTEDVASVLIPRLASENALISKMESARTSRKQKLAEADALLAGVNIFVLQQLGLSAPQEENRLTFAVRRSDVIRDDTFNPDYYHSERISSLRTIQSQKKLRCAPLGVIADFIREAVDVDPTENYIGLAGVKSNTGELAEMVEQDIDGKCFSFEQNDVLFARLRPYLNKIWRAERRGVCSTEFHVIRVKQGQRVLPDYLASILRSSVILAQTKHMMTGNTHPRLANEDVVNLVVPVPDIPIQQTIAAEVTRRREQARRLRNAANTEWEAAKARFEAQLLGAGRA